MKNQGISLITLIITIIVIIILAAIVIFTGLRTPDSAQFSAFTNDVDTVYTAVLDKYGELKVNHAIAGNYRTNEQIYIELATGTDPKQYALMHVDTVLNDGDEATTSIPTRGENDTGLQCQNITNNNSVLKLTLPKVREKTDGWYVTKDGRIFNSTGFTYNKNTYYNATYYTKNNEVNTNHYQARAKAICQKMFSTTPNDYEVAAVTAETAEFNN